MTQGLFSAISGIRANQSKLDVIADNIANVNTVGFKTSLVNFETLFSKTIRSGSAPTGNIGGLNPSQIGLGVRVAEVTKDFSNGNIQRTGRPTDVNIQGEGFFVIDPGNASAGGATSGSLLYTRAGNFSLDANGNLVNPNGFKVLGTDRVTNTSASTTAVRIPPNLNITKTLNANGNVTTAVIDVVDPTTPDPEDTALASFNIDSTGAIVATYSNGDRLTVQTQVGSSPEVREMLYLPAEGGSGLTTTTGLTINNAAIAQDEMQLQVAKFPNPLGLNSEGGNLFSLVGLNAGAPVFGIARANGTGIMDSGSLESSNVDLATELTQMILSQRSLEASGRMINTHNDILTTIVNLAR